MATPNLSERGDGASLVRAGRDPPARGASARSRDGGESTDMEDTQARQVGAGTRSGEGHRGKLSGVGIKVPQATDQIITADGRCAARVPQLRMSEDAAVAHGPGRPKTLARVWRAFLGPAHERLRRRTATIGDPREPTARCAPRSRRPRRRVGVAGGAMGDGARMSATRHASRGEKNDQQHHVSFVKYGTSKITG